jgi:CHASE2 domain-containing sensor protein
MKWLSALALLALSARVQADDFAAKFAVVMIDDQSEAKFGAFPFDRRLLAQAVDACARDRAKAVVLKFFFDQARSAASDTALRDAMRRVPVAVQARIASGEGSTRPIPARFSFGQTRLSAAVRGDRAWVPLHELMDAAAAVGFVDFDRPSIPLVEEYRGVAYKSLVVCCLELALDASARIDSGRVYFGGSSLRVDDSNVYRATLGHQPIAMISFADLLAGKAAREAIEDRVVIIGWDSARTPTVTTGAEAIRIHRFFAECLAACYRELRKSNK